VHLPEAKRRLICTKLGIGVTIADLITRAKFLGDSIGEDGWKLGFP